MDKHILNYREKLIEIALSFVNKEDLHLVRDVVFCGSRAGDWYTDKSDIDIAVSLDKDFIYSPDNNWFESKLNDYTVDIFIKPKNYIHKWRGLESPYYSLYQNKYFPGKTEDIEWLRKHKPDLRKRKNKRG